MSSTENNRAPQPEYHPAYLHGRREMVFVLLVWVAALLWTVPYCYINGYLDKPDEFRSENLELVLGMPSWVFWGIVVPWMASNLVTMIFCFGFMKNDDLGPADEGADLAEEIAEMHSKQEQAQ